jgi:ATP-binding cassette subfamily F protein 3
MILLNARGLRKHYGALAVLDGATLEVRPGEHLGLVGPNGAGKSTLMRILAGREEADAGTVEVPPGVRVGYLEQHPHFDPEHTVLEVARAGLAHLLQLQHEAEEVARQLSHVPEGELRARLARRYDLLQHQLQHSGGYAIEHQVERVLHGLGLHESCYDQRAVELSGGQQSRLLLAQLLLSQPDVLLLDEPSNHLDLETTQWLEGYLAECPQALLVVSHDRYLLDKVTRRTLELFAGTVESYPGNFSAYRQQKEQRLEVQRRTYQRQQEFIAKTEDFIRRNHYGQKHAQAEDRRKKLQRLERVAPPREIQAPVMGFPPASRTGDIVLRVEEAAKRYGRTLFEGLSFDILRGQRWGILGPNACGKTTLLRCIVGSETLDAGRVVLGSGVRIGYLDQLLGDLDPTLPVVEAIRAADRPLVDQQRRDILARFGISGDTALQSIGSLSGGERSRAGLARLAALEANLLVLDEPTNHLDLWARESLERSLREFEGSVLLVSHDRYFLNQVVDHLIVFEPGRCRVVEGNYDFYQHLVRQGLAGAPPEGEAAELRAAPRPASQRPARPQRPKRRFPYRKVADLEADIAACEAQVAELTASLGDPAVYRQGSRVRQIKQQLEELQARLAQLYEHWEEAVELGS